MLALQDNISVVMINRHRTERKILFIEQRVDRQNLKYFHELDKNDTFFNNEDVSYKALMIQTHTFEILELNIIAHEERVLLKEKQFREKNPY
jgi:hypothetical protein